MRAMGPRAGGSEGSELSSVVSQPATAHALMCSAAACTCTHWHGRTRRRTRRRACAVRTCATGRRVVVVVAEAPHCMLHHRIKHGQGEEAVHAACVRMPPPSIHLHACMHSMKCMPARAWCMHACPQHTSTPAARVTVVPRGMACSPAMAQHSRHSCCLPSCPALQATADGARRCMRRMYSIPGVPSQHNRHTWLLHLT